MKLKYKEEGKDKRDTKMKKGDCQTPQLGQAPRLIRN